MQCKGISILVKTDELLPSCSTCQFYRLLAQAFYFRVGHQ